ncbi:MAG: Uma2 family endonuclease [Actinomycetota bacterium]|nr:Uma2 family endonuclease [Actinomycetota bacterium]
MIVPPPTRYAFSVEEWHRMGEAGLFDEDARVELVGGEVVKMTPIGNHHLASVNRLNRLFVVAVGERAIVSIQNPVRLDDHSEPQPDVALLHPRADDYAGATPGPGDAFLIVEVADSSLAWDRDEKAPRYGAAGVPMCWVADLNAGEVLVFSGPGPMGYRDLHRAQRGEDLVVKGLSGVAVSVEQVLGTAEDVGLPDGAFNGPGAT